MFAFFSIFIFIFNYFKLIIIKLFKEKRIKILKLNEWKKLINSSYKKCKFNFIN